MAMAALTVLLLLLPVTAGATNTPTAAAANANSPPPCPPPPPPRHIGTDRPKSPIWALALSFGLLGVLILLSAVACFLMRRRRRKRQRSARAANVAADRAAAGELPPPASDGGGGGDEEQQQQEEEEGGGGVGSWLRSMKTSSPRQGLMASMAGAADVEHDEWMERHPSALDRFDALAAAAKGKQIAVFQDYDGTLSPVVEDPDRAFMTDEMRDAVRGVAACFPTAIVSGRSRDKVFDFVRLPELYYAGSHGMDTQAPAAVSDNHEIEEEEEESRSVLCQSAREFLPVIEKVYAALVANVESSIPGAKVENNNFCLSVHFRCVEEECWGALFEQVRAVFKDHPKLRLTQGRKVLEIRPMIKWDKGNALEFLLQSLERSDVFPIYIGDDRTDEDAFKVLRSRGQGAGILVSKFPKETAASFSLREPDDVKDFLRRLVHASNT